MSISAPDRILARLRTPLRQAGLDELVGLWCRTRVTVDVAPVRWTMARDPRLPGWLRGALGRELMRTASPAAIAGHPCPWSPPCALDPLFVNRPGLRRGEMPKPAVPVLELEGASPFVALDLFGFAADWAEQSATALVAALRTGFDGGCGEAYRLEPLDVRIEELPPAPPVTGATAYALNFRTPLMLRHGQTPQLNALAFLHGLLTRIEGLARWHDIALAADWKAVGTATRRAQIGLVDAREVSWDRHSSRRGRPMPLHGWVGRMLLAGDAALLGPLLAIGSTVGAGGFAAAGLGRFDAVALA